MNILREHSHQDQSTVAPQQQRLGRNISPLATRSRRRRRRSRGGRRRSRRRSKKKKKHGEFNSRQRIQLAPPKSSVAAAALEREPKVAVSSRGHPNCPRPRRRIKVKRGKSPHCKHQRASRTWKLPGCTGRCYDVTP